MATGGRTSNQMNSPLWNFCNEVYISKGWIHIRRYFPFVYLYAYEAVLEL